MKKNRAVENIGKSLLSVAIILLTFFLFFNGLRNVSAEASAQGKKKLEEAIRRTAVACYAAEGAFPPDIEYLVEHYGLSVDESKYIVHYDIFSENLMPDITVLDIEQ